MKYHRNFYFFLSILLILLISYNISLAYSIELDGNKLDLVLLLHANQAIVPYGDVANDLCYHAVLETMLAHPTLHFPLHVSGTLLTDLIWFNQSTINLIKDGVNQGQFEIIGSTYAQNIIYSTDDYDNQIQIQKHQKIIQEIFEVKPKGFWNPERCWNQERYVKLLAEAGYEYTFVEDHILNDSEPFPYPNAEYLVRKTSSLDQSLLIINDDKEIIDRIDNVAFTTQSPSSLAVIEAVDNLINYLYSVYVNDTNDEFLVFYGQDMEVWGLWQEEGRPSDTWENTVARLDYLFTRLEQEAAWLNVGTPTEFFGSLPLSYEFIFLPHIIDGTAVWMEAPSKAEGHIDWFDFSANDPRLNDYRKQFDTVRQAMKTVETEIESFTPSLKRDNAEKLFSYAQFVFVANQYEFGCIGCYFPWYYRAKTALISVEAARYALYPSLTTEALITDLDFDGNNEYILRNNQAMFVFTGLGGRLINWFDIEHGEVLLANDIPNTYATWTVAGLDYPGGTFLASPIEQINGVDLWGRTQKTYQLRPKAFIDTFEDEEANWLWKARNRTVIIGNNFIQFYLDFSSRRISKVFNLQNESPLLIDYQITNNENFEIKPIIGISFTSGNEKILYQGGKNHFEVLTQNSSHQKLDLWDLDSFISLSSPLEAGSITILEHDPMFGFGYSINLKSVKVGETLTYSFQLESKSINNSTISINPPPTTSKPLSIKFSLPNLLVLVLVGYYLNRRRR